MHIGTSYKPGEFIVWTRRKLYPLIGMAFFPVILYQWLGWKWVDVPWAVVGLLGTATAFTVGFKNTQTYNRMAEAQQIWTTILSLSRAWGIMSRDFLPNEAATRQLVYRHLAWLTVLRYQMREKRVWETTSKRHNVEYSRQYYVAEREEPLQQELMKYISTEEYGYIMAKSNPAHQLLSLQGKMARQLFDKEQIGIPHFLEIQKCIKDLALLQGRSERIKDAPYPRQYAVVNTLFVNLFCFLLPFGLLKEFDELNAYVTGGMQGHMVWLIVPFSIIISWIYTSLDQVGESTENPFEGGANDVPITQLSRMIERDMREVLEEQELPASLIAKNNIIL